MEIFYCKCFNKTQIQLCLTKTEKQLELVVVFGIQSIIPLIIKNKKDMEDLNFKNSDQSWETSLQEMYILFFKIVVKHMY